MMACVDASATYRNVPAAFRSSALRTSKSIHVRSPALNIVAPRTSESQARPPAGRPRPDRARVRAPALRNAAPPRLIDGRGRCRLDRCRSRRRAVERHPIDGAQHRNPNLPVLTVLVGVFLEQHDRHDLAVMLTAVDPVAYQINH